MNICVFCSSSNALAPEYFGDAAELGRLIGLGGHSLVFGGANVGSMNVLANEVIRHDGRVVGVIPKTIAEKGLAFTSGGELIVAPNMRERKKAMREMADAFAVLPGGFGTLEEVFEIITLKQLQSHNKPVVFINTLGFFDRLFHFLDHLYSEKFAKTEYQRYYHLVPSPEEAIRFFHSYRPEPFSDKWFNVDPQEFDRPI